MVVSRPPSKEVGAVFQADVKSSTAKSHGIDLPEQEKNFRKNYFPTGTILVRSTPRGQTTFL